MRARQSGDSPARALAGALLACALPMIGCQSPPSRQVASGCPPAPGMTSEQLAGCGCFPLRAGGGYSTGLSQQDLEQPVQQISILNYLCPSRTAGFIKVVAINGVARDVFR